MTWLLWGVLAITVGMVAATTVTAVEFFFRGYHAHLRTVERKKGLRAD